MGEPTKAPQEGEGAEATSKREPSQVTLSAISDVSIAATDAVGRFSAAPRKMRWLPIFGRRPRVGRGLPQAPHRVRLAASFQRPPRVCLRRLGIRKAKKTRDGSLITAFARHQV